MGVFQRFSSLVACVFIGGCGDIEVSKELKSKLANQDDTALFTQTLEFVWENTTFSEEFLCTPTHFPSFSKGNALNSQASFRRKSVAGWSPTPRWMRVEAGNSTLLIRLACEGMWEGMTQLARGEEADALKFYAVKQSGSAIGLTPVTVPSTQFSSPQLVTDMSKAGEQAADRVKSLYPFAGLLRGHAFKGWAEPELVSVERYLPSDGDRKYESEPWVISCRGQLPQPEHKLPETSVFARPGQDVLNLTPGLTNCDFVEFTNNSSLSIKGRSKSPYQMTLASSSGTAHLKDETGAEAFLQLKRMELKNPSLIIHAPSRRTYRGDIDRDPFLDTDFYQNYLADPLREYDEKAQPDWVKAQTQEKDK